MIDVLVGGKCLEGDDGCGGGCISGFISASVLLRITILQFVS